MKHSDHRGQLVEVGDVEVYLGGAQYHPFMSLEGYNIVVPFLEVVPQRVTEALPVSVTLAHYPIPDFSGVPEDWEAFLEGMTHDLHQGSKILAFCMGGHGRTGTFLASLIALLEPHVRDPIAAARRRYCEKAVETKKQAEAIFALKGKTVPAKYQHLH